MKIAILILFCLVLVLDFMKELTKKEVNGYAVFKRVGIIFAFYIIANLF